MTENNDFNNTENDSTNSRNEKRFKLSEPNGAYLIDNDEPKYHWINDDDYVNKEAVRLNNIKTVKIGNEDVDCTNINWELLYELYNGMIDFYYDESGDFE